MSGKIQRMSERRQVNIEMIERMARIEMGLEFLTEKFEAYSELSCSQKGCENHDDIVRIKQTHKQIKVVGTAIITAVSALVVKNLWPIAKMFL